MVAGAVAVAMEVAADIAVVAVATLAAADIVVVVVATPAAAADTAAVEVVT
jgi:hypothetical protein